MRQKISLILGVVCINLFLVACSGEEEVLEDNSQPVTEKAISSDNTEVEIVEEDVVAIVNGEEITGSKYNDMYSQTLVMFQQYGQDATDPELVQEQTLSRLIEEELLLQEVAELGIEAPSSEVVENLEQIKSQFETEEQYKQQLTQLEITEEKLKNQLAYEIKLNEYIEQEVPEVKITDEDIQIYYDQLVSQQGEEVPALEEVKDQIKEVLMNQKRQTNLASVIEILKEESEIDILI